MYDGPNYNPPDVQRHAPGQPPWVQAQAKAMHDGAAWQALQNQKNEQQSPPEPLTEDDLRSLMATVVFFVLGGGWLARYFRNRILRDRRPQLPSPPSGRYLIEGSTSVLFAMRSAVGHLVLILSEQHLRNVLAEYARHYNGHRPHQELQQEAPPRQPGRAIDIAARIERRSVVGSLISEYRRAA